MNKSQKKYWNSLQNNELKKLIEKHGLTVQNKKRKTMISELTLWFESSTENSHPKQKVLTDNTQPVSDEKKLLPLHGTTVRVCEYENIPVFDQQDVGVCVACAFTSMHQIVRNKFLEPQDIYTDRIQDAGAALAEIAKILSRQGQRQREKFEGRKLQSCYSRKRKKSTRERHFTLSTKGPYSQWTDDYVDELKDNIFEGFPVVALMQGISTERAEYETLESDGSSLHAIVITGYYEKDDGSVVLEFLNSYGKSFGWSGFGLMSCDYFQMYCKDMTVITKKQKKMLKRGKGPE